MTQPVDVPILDGLFSYAYLPLYGALCTAVGLVAGIVATLLLVRLLGRCGVAGRWRIALTSGAAVFVVAAVAMWLSWASYTWIRVTGGGVELRYATWPRPARVIPFDQIESVSAWRSTGRRGGVSYHLVIATKPDSPSGWYLWRSESGSQENVGRAIEWIEHASGGRVPSRR